MTKSATAPFHCGVHAIRPPQALPSSLDFHLNSSASTAGEPFGARTAETTSHQEHVAPATLSETGGRRSWRRIGRPWKAEKYKKNRHFRKHRYDVRIVKAEARGPTRSVFSGRPGDVKRSPNAASRSAAVGLSASERAGCERGETKSRLSY
jgi:hypothetical protein